VGIAHDLSSLFIQGRLHGIFLLFVDPLHQYLERRVDGPMVREAEWRIIVVNLSDVVTLAKYAVAPGGNACFLRCVVLITVKVVLVCRRESYAGLGVVREGQSSNHLEVKLLHVSYNPNKQSTTTHLIVVVQGLEVTNMTQPLHLLVVQSNSVVKVAEPYDSVMVFD
jgi:hypothetical protein